MHVCLCLFGFTRDIVVVSKHIITNINTIIIIMILSLWLIALVIIGASTTPTSHAKDCATVSRGKELKKLVQGSHVLVALQLDSDEEEEGEDEANESAAAANNKDDSSSVQELCQRLQATPEARVSDFEIAVVTDSNLQRKVWTSSRPAPRTWVERALFRLEEYNVPLLSSFLKQRSETADTTADTTADDASPSPSLPEFVLFRQGTSYELGNGLRHVQNKGIESTSSPSVDADAVSAFVGSWLQRQKLGNYVYSLGTYDLMAAQTMQWVAEERPLAATLWVHGVGRLTKYLVQPATMEFESELAAMYVKCATKVLEHGVQYPSTQIERLERLLGGTGDSSGDDEGDSSTSAAKISPLQREQLSQRLYVWKKFADPITVTSEDLWKFMGRLILNLASVLGMAILVPLVLFAREEEYEDDEQEEDEQGKEVDETELNNNDDEDHPTEEASELPSPNVAKKLFASEESTEDEQQQQQRPTTSSSGTSATPKDMTKKEKRELAVQRAKTAMEADKKRVEAIKAKKAHDDDKATTGAAPAAPTFSESELDRMTVIDLKELLRERNLKVSGKKAELVSRLVDAGK
jgi:hypothetical protein